MLHVCRSSIDKSRMPHVALQADPSQLCVRQRIQHIRLLLRHELRKALQVYQLSVVLRKLRDHEQQPIRTVISDNYLYAEAPAVMHTASDACLTEALSLVKRSSGSSIPSCDMILSSSAVSISPLPAVLKQWIAHLEAQQT